MAGSGGTFVDVQVAVVALEPRHAETLVHVDTVLADGPILTRLGVTFVNVLITVRPLVARHTLALVPNVEDVGTSSTVLTRLFGTSAHVIQAVVPCESDGAVAGIAVESIQTVRARTFARVALALVYILGAVVAREAVWAVAGEVTGAQGAGAVGARLPGAGVVEVVTVLTHVPHRRLRAQTHVLMQVVEARAAIVTWRWETPVRCCCAQQA